LPTYRPTFVFCMNTNNSYRRYTWFVLIMVFFVIIAGGVVRMTQSGMGCPDWPRCFGRWVPPVSANQLPADYEKYLKTQDIDHSFNAWHTWIEYINRLSGALLGIFILIHFVWSFRVFRKTNRSIVILSLLMLLAVGFQGWLGKKVVDANLAVVKVTIHMLMALVLAALPVIVISKLSGIKITADKWVKNLSVIALLLLIIQIILGTEVRSQIDQIAKPLDYGQRETWMSQLDSVFLIHRSFSWIVAIACILLYKKSQSLIQLRSHRWLILSLISLSLITGIVMYYLNIPALAQPIHLFSASVLAITLFSFRLQLK
jgi:cytochrome c oxidase assembly protein subunit 15